MYGLQPAVDGQQDCRLYLLVVHAELIRLLYSFCRRSRSAVLQVGRSFSLGDALGLGAKLLAQADIRRLADRMVWWLGQSR